MPLSEPRVAISVPVDKADNFAGTWLIPTDSAHRLTQLKSLDDVRRSAEDMGVSPGGVGGRLHHDGLRPWSWGAGVKARVDFVDDPNA